MGVLRVKSRIILLVSILFAIAFASVVSSEMLPFSDRYYKDFYEGEEMTLDLRELDTVRFTYYETNYSMRLLNIYTDSATIRVEMSAMDVQKNQPVEFDLDNDDEWDLNVELMFPDSDEAMFKLELNEIEEPEPPEPPVENNTNTTNSTDTTNSTNSTDDSDDNSADDNSDDDTISQNTTANTNSNSNNQTAPDEITGDVVYNINIDIEIPPGSGIGVLLIVAIVLGGLVAYKKLKKKYGNEEINEAVSRKKQSKKLLKPTHPVNRKVAAKKAVKKFMKNTRKSFRTGRQRFAGLIAGDDFVKKPKN